MSRFVNVVNRSRDGITVAEARWCESWLCRLRGLMFRSQLPESQSLLIVESAQSRSSTSIHMFFVFMDLGVIWIDRERRVVDCRVARPWRLYFPAAPAQFVLEGEPSLLERVEVGDLVEFRDVTPS